jgi:hypothetical protein
MVEAVLCATSAIRAVAYRKIKGVDAEDAEEKRKSAEEG